MATLSGAMFVMIADMSYKEFEVANQMAGFEGSQSGILTGHNRNFHSVIYIRFNSWCDVIKEEEYNSTQMTAAGGAKD